MSDDRPIGVFDSGVGGLTVARAIWGLLPNESVAYVGDGAHFPYGPKPVEEIRGYAVAIARHLVDRGVKLLVVACNSIEVSAIGDIAAAADVPVVGVIAPGVRAALRATRNGTVGVIGTEATIRTGAYQRAIGQGTRTRLIGREKGYHGVGFGGISVGAVMRTILPFYAALIAALMFVTYVPAFSLCLPRLLMGYKG